MGRSTSRAVNLAAFLDAERGTIVEHFSRRIRGPVADGHDTSRPALLGDLSGLLAEVASRVREVPAEARSLLPEPGTRQGQGSEPARSGPDMRGLIDELALLSDCIYERMEQLALVPSVSETRRLNQGMAAAARRALAREALEQRSTQSGVWDTEQVLSLFDQAPGFVCFVRGPSLIFELANESYYQLVGHRPILGKSVREALPELEGQGFYELLERVFASGESYVGRGVAVRVQRVPEAPLLDAFVDFIYQPIRGADGDVIGILAQGHDVTELKNQETQRAAAEAALRASQERYQALFASIDDGYCLMQVLFNERGRPCDYKFLETNAAFESHTGLFEAVGKRARELVPSLDDSWFEIYGRVALTGEPERFENHAPAMARWFDVYASRVGDPAQHLVVLVFKDITERKRMEAERQRLFEAEAAARRAAEESNRLRDEFVATVSHELRTPLNAILGWAHLLRPPDTSPERRAKAVEIIERNARTQAHLIDDLLDVSRILAGKLRLRIAPVCLATVAEAAVDTVRPSADLRSVALSLDVDPELTVLGDAHRLQQMVWNLISNAVKFTPKGGHARVTVARSGASAELTVVDDGRGISSSFLPHVFESFRQADGSTTRSEGGLGLGLSIVRQLAEMHGGTVRAESEGDGKGATFTVNLPVASDEQMASHRASLTRESLAVDGLCCPPELEGLDVLVVDDDGDARELLRTLLEGGNARVRVASSAAEALQLFMHAAPELVVSDIGMPEEDGFALIGKIRALSPQAGGDVPAIAVSAYVRPDERNKALSLGFSTYLTKPVEPLELMAVISSLALPALQRRASAT